jgi:hypothetical protein
VRRASGEMDAGLEALDLRTDGHAGGRGLRGSEDGQRHHREPGESALLPRVVD